MSSFGWRKDLAYVNLLFYIGISLLYQVSNSWSILTERVQLLEGLISPRGDREKKGRYLDNRSTD